MNRIHIKKPWHTAKCFILPLLLSITLLACKQIRSEREPHWFKQNYAAFDNKEYVDFFLQRINDSTPIVSSFESIIRDYYRDNGAPIWTYNGFQENKIDTLLHYFDLSWRHGIGRNYFQYDSIAAIIAGLRENRVEDGDLMPTLFQLEMMLTENYLNYAKALAFGATDPKVVNGGKWLYNTQHADTVFLRNTLASSENTPKSLRVMQPNMELYALLQEELLRLHELKDTAFTRIPLMHVRQGQANRHLPKICQRLRLTGELPETFPDTTLLTSELIAGINLFRSDNAIPESDSLDKETIEKLNRPIAYYQNRIAANLERLRWKVIPEKGENRIEVNLPDFTLQAFIADTVAFRTRICCGKTQVPGEGRKRHGMIMAYKAETPLLHSQINRIILNPEWNIPYDIIKNEYLPKLRKNNMAVIKREHLYVMRGGKQVVPDSIDWNKVSYNNIPYRLIQSSGRYNALGRIKFDFPNSESVYLHDTNNKGAFKRRKRTFSHGCVRV
nr:L,D-transpeptidase family protein [Bacteroidales bacterium]